MKPEQILGYAKSRFVGDLGMTDEQFYGVMGSVMGESGRGLDSRAYNPNDPEGGAHGIFQHVGSRWTGLQDYAAKNGLDPYDPRTQIDYVADVELQGSESGALKAVLSAEDRFAATEAWTRKFERPAANAYHLDRRGENANHVAELAGGGALDVPFGDATAFSSMGSGEVDLLTRLALGLNDPNAEKDLSLEGESNFGQKALILGGALADNKMGAKFMLDLVGGGGKPPADLSILDSIAIIAGSHLGGVPGAMVGAGLADIVGDLFDPKGDERRAARGKEKWAAKQEKLKAKKAEESGQSPNDMAKPQGGTDSVSTGLVEETGSLTGTILSDQNTATGTHSDPLPDTNDQMSGSFGSDGGAGFLTMLSKLFGG